MTWMWLSFALVFAASLFVELFSSRSPREISPRESLVRTLIWVILALAFNLGIYIAMGTTPALEFLTGYLIEYSLSVDNIFVFIMLFSAFVVPGAYRKRVLTWGILGAIVLRGLMILVGAALINRFEWLMYLFGAFLIYTGIKMVFSGEDEAADPAENKLVLFLRKVLPLTAGYESDRLMVRRNSRRWFTPLLVVLVVVETTDIMFALDSIPAIFAITTNPFIVLTSNIFAIMGLRSLYFLLDGIMGRFRFLKYGLFVILTFIGVKMIIVFWGIHVPIMASLAVVIGVLALSIILSVVIPEQHAPDAHTHSKSG